MQFSWNVHGTVHGNLDGRREPGGQATGGLVGWYVAVLLGDTVIREVGPSTWITLGSLCYDRFYQDVVLWELL